MSNLKKYAVSLKQAGYPLYEIDGRGLSLEMRQTAIQLHYYGSLCMMSCDGQTLDDTFIARNARELISSGMPYMEFVETIKKYDLPLKCNVVWNDQSVAYRCYTCGLNPCMSICGDCFEAGDHRGHDFNRFFSSSGGKCDCGDEDVIRESGFCVRHGKRNNPPKNVPIDLTAMAELIMIKSVTVFSDKLRGFSNRRNMILDYRTRQSTCISEFVSQKIMAESDELLGFLDELISLASPFVNMMADILCNNKLYSTIRNYHKFKEELDEDTFITIEEMDMLSKKEDKLLEDVSSLKEYVIPPCLVRAVNFLPRTDMKFECLLDELMFYQVRNGFPQSLVNFLLKLLPNDQFKMKFAKNLFENYDLVERLIFEIANNSDSPVNTHIPHKIVARVVQITVQIVSSENMCNMLQKEVNILRRVLESLLRMIFENAAPVNNNPAQSEPWFSLSMEHNEFLSSEGYSGAITDLQNLFVHPKLLESFFEDAELAGEFALLVGSLEGVSPLKRIASGNHVEMEDPTAVRMALRIEMEISTVFIVQTLYMDYDSEKLRYFANCLMMKLEDYFGAVFPGSSTAILSNNYAFFHIPLHRQLAAVCLKYFTKTKKWDILSDNEDFLRSTIAHPLRLRAVISEYFAGMWVRNGSDIKLCVATYLTSRYFISQDNDLAFIRIVAAKLRPIDVGHMIWEAYHLDDCFKYCCLDAEVEKPSPTATIYDRNWMPFMFDGYFKLLLEIIFIRSVAERTMEEEIRLQLIYVLASIEKAPYSRIRRYFYYLQQMNDSLFERILHEVALFVTPTGTTSSNQHGHYVLKAEHWANVDLIQSRFRVTEQQAVNTIILRQGKELAKNFPSLNDRTPWPYYRIYDLSNDDPIFSKTAQILMQPSNILVCRLIIEWYLYSDLSISIVQQTVYVLTLILKLSSMPFASEFELEFVDQASSKLVAKFGENRSQFFEYFNRKPDRPLYADAKETDSLTTLIIKLFNKVYAEEFSRQSNKVQTAKLLQKSCDADLAQMNQLVGSGVDYVGRLIAWLFKCDPVSRQIIEDEVLSNVTSQQASLSSPMDKKMAARKRQFELLEMQKAKQADLLKKFADKEGMNSAFDKTEISDRSSRSDVYCSICNDVCDDEYRSLFGSAIYVQTGSVSEDSITVSTSSNFAVGETGEMENASEGILMATYRDFEKEAIPAFYKVYPESSVFSLLSYVELRTCAHYSHLSCFQTYRETIMADEHTSTSHHIIPCPFCRTSISYILPLSPKLEWDSTVKFNEHRFFENEEECILEIIHRHLEFGNLASAFLSIDSLNHYEELKKKICDLIKNKEALRSLGEKTYCAPMMMNSMDKNPCILPLSLIRNYVDRVTVIEEHDIKFSSRLRSALTDSLYFFACVDNKGTTEKLFAAFWTRLHGGDSRKFDVSSSSMPPLLHYDSQTVLVLSSAALTVLNLSGSSRLDMFRVFFKFSLVHCLIRTLVISLLNRPVEKRKPILDKLISSNFNLSNVYSRVKDYLMQSRLIDSSCSSAYNAVDMFADSTNNTVQTVISKFLQFALNLAAELRLVVHEIKTPKREDFTFAALLEFCSELLLSQQIQLIDVVSLVEHSNRINVWLTEFMHSASDLSPCYADTIWTMKTLRRLPDSFDTLFKAYFGQKCVECGTVPSQPMICLVCGKLVCLNSCCETKIREDGSIKVKEIEMHANTCCSGSGCFLSVASTMGVLIHRRVSRIYQSPYLDKHLEEDRNLQRGKSLHLMHTNYEQLCQLWITHNFEQTVNASTFFPIETLSGILRDCHHYM